VSQRKSAAFRASRRSFLKSVSGLALTSFTPFTSLFAADRAASPIITKAIPASGEKLPVIGMGSWLTFDVGSNKTDRARCVKILQTFFDRGGGMVDSSPHVWFFATGYRALFGADTTSSRFILSNQSLDYR